MSQLCAARKSNLEESLLFYQFLQDSEEEEAWLVEQMRLVKSQDVGKDLRGVISKLRRHEVRGSGGRVDVLLGFARRCSMCRDSRIYGVTGHSNEKNNFLAKMLYFEKKKKNKLSLIIFATGYKRCC